ncbi:MAG: lipoyl(octanoyl) transferase LipB [Pseudohongiellaceae bacterium]
MTGLIVRNLGEQPYEPVWRRMQHFTAERGAETPDEIWVLSHPPVYTQGQAGLAEHILNPGDIPVVPIDRGGQVTYHGPGQCVVYLLIDIRRARLGVRDLVSVMEDSIIRVLDEYGLQAVTRDRAPGVYVGNAKIASLGLRIRRGCSYHGLAFNLDMDLSPFAGINPCGYQGLDVTQLRDLVPVAGDDLAEKASARLVEVLTGKLSCYHPAGVSHSADPRVQEL